MKKNYFIGMLAVRVETLTSCVFSLIFIALGQVSYAQPLFNSEGASSHLFSVSPTNKVRFSQGNLQYQPSSKTWRFAESQYYLDRSWYKHGNYESYKEERLSDPGWIDAFVLGANGCDLWCATSEGGLENQPLNAFWECLENYNNGFYHKKVDLRGEILKQHASDLLEWGWRDPISNGGNKSGIWRMLTPGEWNYLLWERPMKNDTSIYALRHIYAAIDLAENGKYVGLIIFPDDYNPTSFVGFNIDHAFVEAAGKKHFKSWKEVCGKFKNHVCYHEPKCASSLVNHENVYTKAQWQKMEKDGCVFLPVPEDAFYARAWAGYWFYGGYFGVIFFDEFNYRPRAGELCLGYVRLVQDEDVSKTEKWSQVIERLYLKEKNERLAEEKAWKDAQASLVNKLLDRSLIPFSSAKQNSMVAYKLIDFKKVDSKSANITYKIDLRDKRNGGYITYQTTYRVSDGRLVDANGDWRNSKRINNLYDTIAALESLMLESLAKENLLDISKAYTKQCLVKKISAVTMDEYKKKLVDQARLIEYCMNFAIVRKAIASNGDTLTSKATECKRCKDILGMYNTYFKTVPIAWNPKENADEAVKRLNDLVAAQEVYMIAMELHKTIEAKDAELMAKVATCKNVVKAYSTYFKTADNNWKERTTATELKKALDEIDATQGEFAEALESYTTLAENNAAIMEKVKVCKNIVKAYNNYISDMEKDFAVTTNPAELNRDINVCIEAQDYIKEAVNSGNAAELDQKVKALKDKSIDSVLQAIK